MQHGIDMQVVLTWTEFVKSTDDLVVRHVDDHKLSVCIGSLSITTLAVA